MTALEAMLKFFMSNNAGPATREFEAFIGELPTAGRAFYVDDGVVRVSYETTGGDVVQDKLVYCGQFHPVKVARFISIEAFHSTPQVWNRDRTPKLWVVA